MREQRSEPKVVGYSNIKDVVRVLVAAFYADPLSTWIFPDPLQRREQLRRFLTLGVEGTMRYPCVWLNEIGSATSVWIPPGGTEYSPVQADRFEPLLVELLGTAAAPVVETFDLLTRSHPSEDPHYFLSMLATDPEHAGHVDGLTLLADNLRLVDQEQTAVYLEASNAVNIPLYLRYGFELVPPIAAPGGGPDVFTMWREAVVSVPNEDGSAPL